MHRTYIVGCFFVFFKTLLISVPFIRLGRLEVSVVRVVISSHQTLIQQRALFIIPLPLKILL